MTARRRRPYNARQFKRHVLVFVGVTAAVFALVLYFSFARTTVTVTPALQRVERTVSLTVGPADAATMGLAGILRTTTVRASATEPVPAEGEGAPAAAGGIVHLVNNAARNQPLVAGTRLLSASGVLFRTTESVLVPRGKSADVGVRADKPGPAGEIGPSHFEIVALWASLKPLIYGESTAAFTGGTVRTGIVTEALAANVRTSALTQAAEQARATLQTALANEDPDGQMSVLGVQIAPTQEQWSAQIGEAASALTLSMTATATGVVAVTEAFDTVMASKFADSVPAQTKLYDRVGTPNVVVREVDVESRSAALVATQMVRVTLDPNDPLLQPSQFVNKNRRGIEAHLRQFDAVQTVDVRFSPFWVLRASGLADHITVKILPPAAQ